MRLKLLQQTLILYWRKFHLQVNHDEATCRDRNCSYDHVAGVVGAVAVPYCRRLRVDLANTRRSGASID